MSGPLVQDYSGGSTPMRYNVPYPPSLSDFEEFLNDTWSTRHTYISSQDRH